MLQIEGIVKRFGTYTALDGITMEVPPGKVFGLLGPNGAGKTTLIRIITRITGPDEGRVLLNGREMGPEDVARMGYLPEALLNYLGRMGWSMPDEREKFTLGEMLSHFDIMRVSLGGPVFDLDKLSWLNALWIAASQG